jgi:rare lipoprotein A
VRRATPPQLCWQLAIWLLVPVLMSLAGCAARSKAPAGLPKRVLEIREGFATYYGKEFNGRPAASGERFDMTSLVAAHPTYPFGTRLRVTNLANGRTVQVRVIDRGPAAGPRATGVLIDLSYRAAEALRFIEAGRTRVRLEVLRWGG